MSKDKEKSTLTIEVSGSRTIFRGGKEEKSFNTYARLGKFIHDNHLRDFRDKQIKFVGSDQQLKTIADIVKDLELNEKLKKDEHSARIFVFSDRIVLSLYGERKRFSNPEQVAKFIINNALGEYAAGEIVFEDEENVKIWEEIGDHIQTYNTQEHIDEIFSEEHY